MPPVNNNPAPTNPNPAPQWGTPPAMPPAVPNAVPDLNPQPAFDLGTPAPAAPPAPATPPAAEEPPAWAKQFISGIDERFNDLESKLTPEPPTSADPNAPIGGAPPTASELAALNPKSWEDVDKYVQTKVQEGVQAGIQQFQGELTQAQKDAKAAEDAVNKELDAAVDALQNEGFLPPISNPNDSNDPGRVARRELYGVAAKLGTTDLAAVAKTVLPTYHQQGKMYDPITDSLIDYNPRQPGAQAPIGSSVTTTGAGGNKPTYEEIHKARSFSELRARAGF